MNVNLDLLGIGVLIFALTVPLVTIALKLATAKMEQNARTWTAIAPVRKAGKDKTAVRGCVQMDCGDLPAKIRANATSKTLTCAIHGAENVFVRPVGIVRIAHVNVLF